MKWSPRLRIVLLVMTVLVCGRVHAQQYHLHNVWQRTTPGSLTYKTFEDSKGYLWFLTNEGIARFDGKNTRIFTDKDGYEDVGAFHVVESKSGILYFLSTNFNVFAFSQGSFTKIKIPAPVAWLDQDNQGTIYLILREGGPVLKLNADNSHTLITSFNIPGKVYMGMHIANDTFIISNNWGMWLVSPRSASKLLHADTYNTFSIARMFRTKEQILLTGDSGIYVLTNNRRAKLLYPAKQTEFYSICEDPLTKDLWVASSMGLEIFKNGITPSSKPIQLPHHTDMFYVMRSRNNSFWVSSAHKGVYVINPRTKHVTTKEGLLADNILHIGRSGKRVFYFTQDNAYYEQEANGIKLHWLGENRSKQYLIKIVSKVLQVNDTALFVYTSGINVITPKKLLSIEHKAGQRAHMHTESYGRLVMGRIADHSIAVDDSMNTLITPARFRQLCRDAEPRGMFMKMDEPDCIDGDTVYYVANNMLLKAYWKGETPVCKYWKVDGKVAHVIRGGNAVQVSTYTNGFYLITGDNVRNIRPHDGLLSNFCRKSCYYKGRIWIATNMGISRIDSVSPLKITNFTQPDYLIDNEVNNLFFMNDTVYVATSSGVSIFPENIAYIRNIPQVFIERLQINNRDTPIGDHYELPYTDNNFTLHFSSPDYRSSNNNLFRLVIVQNDRTDTTYYTTGVIQLSSLMPADYTLFISAKNIDGIWSNPVQFSLNILPPVWRTWWFLTLAVLVISGGIITVVLFSFRRHKQQQAYKIKMVESELRSLRLYMNPHFIFNSLSSLQSFIITYQNRDAEVFISKFSKLIRSVMSFSQRGEITLEEEITLLTNYLLLEKVRFKDRFDFRVTAEDGIDTANTMIPSLLIQPFAENAIKHGFSKLDGRKGMLDITFNMQGEHLYCTITDNGKGRQPNEVSSNHISSGISFTEERLRLITQNPKQEVIRLIDLEADGKPAGLRVIIYVPILNLINE